MKIKVSETNGQQLNWLVATCEQWGSWDSGESGETGAFYSRYGDFSEALFMRDFSPSTNWSQGGAIIEREKITLVYEPSLLYDDSCRWKAIISMENDDYQYGPTPLIAAMRCYAVSKFGDEVDVPQELCK